MAEKVIGTKVEFDVRQAVRNSEKWLQSLRNVETATNRFAQQSQRAYYALGQGIEQVTRAIEQNTRATVGGFQGMQMTMERVGSRVFVLTGAQKKSTDATNRSTKAWAANLKKMALWAAGAASAYRLYMKLRRTIEETVVQVYGNTQEMKRLVDAWDNFKLSLVAAAAPQSEVLEFLERLAGLLNRTSDLLLEQSAIQSGYRAVVERNAEGQNEWVKALMQIPQAALNLRIADEILHKLGITSRKLSDSSVFIDAYNNRLEENAKVLAMGKNAAGGYEKAIGNLISVSNRYTDALSRHAERQREINQTYQEAVNVIGAQYYQRLFKIDQKYQEQVSKINTTALKSRQKAYADYYQQIANMQRRARLQEKQSAERHAMEMEFARRRYTLTMLQNERLYQYQRGLLVAEGDVLAIEDLDARYELERQAAEENFKLQMEQAEAMFRLQQRYQQEANREQLRMLKMALQEQLRAIEEARREQLEEAKETATEERSEAAAQAGERLADAKVSHKEQLEANDEWLQGMKRQTAERLAEIAKEHDLSASEVLSIWGRVMGTDGELSIEVVRTVAEQKILAAQFGAAWKMELYGIADAARAAMAAISAIGRGGRRSTGGRGARERARARQYGGDEIVSSPTTFIAGEGNRAERVKVMPLSPIGGSISLGWRGDPIPINGTGQLSGLDLGSIGDAIAQGIVVELQSQLLGFRAQRGG